MTDRQRDLDRIEKLLALAKSSNPHEANSAQEKAERLMKEHGISPEELTRNDAGLFEVSLGWEGFGATWKFSLATAAARYHGCEAVGFKKRRRLYVNLVGSRKAEVNEAEALFKDMCLAMAGLEKVAAADMVDRFDDGEDEDVSPRQCVDSFRRGATAGMIWKLAVDRPDRFGLRRSAPSTSPASPPSSSPPRSSQTQSQPQPETKPTESSEKSLVRSHGAATDQSERVNKQYKPKVKPLDLDEVASSWWYGYGRQLAEDYFVAPGEDFDEDEEWMRSGFMDDDYDYEDDEKDVDEEDSGAVTQNGTAQKR